jgi:UDP-glucose 4-epimerase
MRYVITGQEGLIGRSLKERLDEKGHECVLGVDLRDGKNINKISDYKIEKADIFFHLAAHCKINESVDFPEKTFMNNARGAENVFEFCRKNKIPKIVYFSSSRVEHEERNPYTASKLYGEELCKAYKQCYGIDFLIIRPSTVYAPGEDLTHRLMDIWVNNAKQGKDLEIRGDKNKSLGFTYIDDFLDGLDLILEKSEWNKDYTICGKSCKLVEVANEIIKQSGSKSKIIYKNAEIAQPQIVENGVSKELIDWGFNPKIDIVEGIRRCLNYK